jgi:hypothetical protein
MLLCVVRYDLSHKHITGYTTCYEDSTHLSFLTRLTIYDRKYRNLIRLRICVLVWTNWCFTTACCHLAHALIKRLEQKHVILCPPLSRHVIAIFEYGDVLLSDTLFTHHIHVFIVFIITIHLVIHNSLMHCL